MPKVAIITGGASGIGLAVATSLSQDSFEKWSVHVFDINDIQGNQAAQSIGAMFHQCDVTDYASLASEFHNVFSQEKRLDFVHANAGIIGQPGFAPAAPVVADEPPPPPDMKVMHVNLLAVISTSWLAMHYFGLTKQALGESWEGNLVMTGSISSFYATYAAPLYGAAKYGVLGLVRSLAVPAHRDHRVRVNCICPGLVLTGMTAQAGYPTAHMTPTDTIVKAVRVFIDGKSLTDSSGVTVADGQVFGRALEVSTTKTFKFQEMPSSSDEGVAGLLSSVPKWAN